MKVWTLNLKSQNKQKHQKTHLFIPYKLKSLIFAKYHYNFIKKKVYQASNSFVILTYWGLLKVILIINKFA